MNILERPKIWTISLSTAFDFRRMGKLGRINENSKLHPGEPTVRKRENLAKDRIQMEATDRNVL